MSNNTGFHVSSIPPIRGILLDHVSGGSVRLQNATRECGISLESVSHVDEVPKTSADFIIVQYDEDELKIIAAITVLSGRFHSRPILALLPIGASEQLRTRVLRSGAADILFFPFCDDEFRCRVKNIVNSKQYQLYRRETVIQYEEDVHGAIGEIMLREYETLYVLGKASEYKDQETGSHIARVAHYSKLIAR
ncbi:MAG: hypothetical protein AB1798_21365, partial [Spirochaetota bacterium]